MCSMNTPSRQQIRRIFVIGIPTVLGLIIAGLILNFETFVSLAIIASVLFNIYFFYSGEDSEYLTYIPHSLLMISLGIMMYYPNSIVVTGSVGILGIVTCVGTIYNSEIL